jgi:outer membrane protein insertion porin family
VSFSKKSLLWGLVLIVCVAVSPIVSAPRLKIGSASAEREASELQIISDIRIEGDWLVPKSAIFEDTKIQLGDEFLSGQLNREAQRIRDLGYFESVQWYSQPSAKGQVVTFVVKEYPQVGSVQFEGNRSISENALLDVINSQEDEIFNPKGTLQDTEAINELYAKKGFIDCKVVGIKPPENNGDPLTFVIQEKTIQSIVISGNRLTQPYVITREMDLQPGSVIQSSVLQNDLRRIFNLNYFNKLNPVFYDGDTPSQKILHLDVDEKRTGNLSFGGGYSPVVGFNIFTNIMWDNFFGTGQTVALNGNFDRATTYQFRYYNPWMWDKRQSFSFRMWSRNGQAAAFNPFLGGNTLFFRNEISSGGEIGFGFPTDDHLRFDHFFKFDRVNLTVPSSNEDPRTERNYTVQSYTFRTSYDTRDIMLNPTKGTFSSLSIENAFKMASSSLEYTRFDVDLRYFHPVVDKQVLASHLTLGYLRAPLINDQNLFAREYYRVGGVNTVRGYDDFNPFAIGNKMIMVNLEYRFLFEGGFQFLLFVDAGYATNFFVKDNADGTKEYTTVGPFEFGKYRIGKGAGIRFEVPQLGPIRLDLGLDDQGAQRIHFSMGQSF